MSDCYRVAVTGSRGKSGVVRLIHAAFCGCGLRAYARITGVVPREMTPDAERPILRPSGANISEMKWWLRGIPADTEAIVLENSAVMPELQGLAALWLKPQVSVLTNIRPDHEAFWGPGEDNVLKALAHALPRGGAVVVPPDLAAYPGMLALAEEKKLRVIAAPPIPNLPAHLSANMGLALAVCRFFGLNEELCLNAMMSLKPDLADYTVLSFGDGRLAFAFSANDVTTTEELFRSTGWRREETGILFNHRDDRIDRYRSFSAWMNDNPWREILVIGDRPPKGAYAEYFHCEDAASLARRVSKGNWLGCGNTVYGLTLELKLRHEEGSLSL